MNNVSQIIKQHNKNVSSEKEKQTYPCNYRNKNECPLNGHFKVQNVFYKCTVSATQTFKQHVYLRIAEENWKQRLYNHRQSFKGYPDISPLDNCPPDNCPQDNYPPDFCTPDDYL